jgi:hypothetical protein
MENNIIKDRLLGNIDVLSDVRVRVVGTISNVDTKIGTFELVYEEKRVTCLPPISQKYHPLIGDNVTLVGRIVPTDNNEIEIRTESVAKISKEELDSYIKYLKLRNEVLNNGS